MEKRERGREWLLLLPLKRPPVLPPKPCPGERGGNKKEEWFRSGYCAPVTTAKKKGERKEEREPGKDPEKKGAGGGGEGVGLNGNAYPPPDYSLQNPTPLAVLFCFWGRTGWFSDPMNDLANYTKWLGASLFPQATVCRD